MINPADFGDCDKHIVEKILNSISTLLEAATHVRSPRSYEIRYKDDCPECCSVGAFRIIFLSIEGDYWGQWAYQFAHEYCHHLIDGPMTGEIKGLVWFEECLCELASRYVLERLSNEQLCDTLGLQNANRTFQDYRKLLLSKSLKFESELQWPGSVHKWLMFLEKPQYFRSHYSLIAAKMLPIFLEQPHLWKIIAHIDDSTQYKSLEDLFSHLEKSCPQECHEALHRLRFVLLGAQPSVALE